MLRIVADTNTVVSGLLWAGPPHRVLQAAAQHHLVLCTSPALLTEVEEVLRRGKFAARLRQCGFTADSLSHSFRSVARVVRVTPLSRPVIRDDPDDDEVLACALVVGADCIVSGDHHLRGLMAFRGIPILNACDFLGVLKRA